MVISLKLSCNLIGTEKNIDKCLLEKSEEIGHA